MTPVSPASDERVFLQRAVEASIRVGVIALIAIWCFQIARPFLDPFVWGVVIAVAAYPAYAWLERRLGGRSRLAAALLTVLALLVLIAPTVQLTASLVETAERLSNELREGHLSVPPPPEGVANWPVIGERLYGFWQQAYTNLESLVTQVEPQLRAFGGWLLSTGVSTGIGVLKFILSLLIAGFLLANSQRGSEMTRSIGRRLAGERGAEFADLAGATVQSVARGILGVALIQSLAAGLGLLFADVPGAGLWALLVLVLAVIQLPPLLVLAPIVVYVFQTGSTTVAILFAIWSVLVSVSDSFLKPILLGRGVDVPMVVIFVGALGGFMVQGIIGLFIGAVVMSLGYKLFVAWLEEGEASSESPDPEPATPPA